MAKKKIVWIAVAALVVAATGASFAQYGSYEVGNTGFVITAGAFRPVESETRDNLGKTWIDAGLSYRLSSTGDMESSIGVGYISAEGQEFTVDSTAFETKATIIPVTYNVTVKPSVDSRFYYKSGVGAYFTKIEGLDAAGAASNGAEESKTRFGYTLGAGLQLTNSIALEAGYTRISGKVQSQKLSGFSLALKGSF